MAILVLGGAGYIGSHTVYELIDAGREVVVAVTGGRLDFGTWEQIFYFEFDGKRDKHALIKIIGE